MGTVYGSRHLSNMFKPQNWSPGFLRIWNHHKPSIFWWYDWLILSHVFLGWNVTSELCFTQLRSASQTVVYSQYKTGDILNSWGAWNPVFFLLETSAEERCEPPYRFQNQQGVVSSLCVLWECDLSIQVPPWHSGCTRPSYRSMVHSYVGNWGYRDSKASNPQKDSEKYRSSQFQSSLVIGCYCLIYLGITTLAGIPVRSHHQIRR